MDSYALSINGRGLLIVDRGPTARYLLRGKYRAGRNRLKAITIIIVV